MKKTLKGYILGILSSVILFSIIAYAANTTTLYNVRANGVKIVIDGKELHPTDVNGNKVEPIIYNGTTYLPVRAVANAFNKAVQWDGPNYTVYLGDMDGKLKEPSATLDSFENLGYGFGFEKLENVSDNYGGYYSSAYRSTNGWYKDEFYECLLDKKYSVFRATLFLPEGSKAEESRIKIVGDDKVLFETAAFNKISKPIEIEVEIKDVNDFRIVFDENHEIYIANAGFYQ